MPTNWPLRQALSLALRLIIATGAVPAVNADLSARLTGAAAVQLSDASIVLGDLGAIREPTICLDVATETILPASTDSFVVQFELRIVVKVPGPPTTTPKTTSWWETASSITCATSSPARRTRASRRSTPPRARGSCPPGSAFTDCRLVRVDRPPAPALSADGFNSYELWVLTHHAQISYYLNRPQPLGG